MPEKENEFDYWNDNEFIEELDLRSNNYEYGNTRGVPWEETKARILSSTGKDKKEN